MKTVSPTLTKGFSLYRNTYNFTDKEIYFFLASLLCFVLYLVYLFFTSSILEIKGKMFVLFLFPLALFIYFDIKATLVNRKRKKLILKRKIKKSEQLSKIFIISHDDNSIMLSKFTPKEEVKLKASRFLDINYELKMLALDRGYEAVIGVKKENGIVRGFFANSK